MEKYKKNWKNGIFLWIFLQKLYILVMWKENNCMGDVIKTKFPLIFGNRLATRKVVSVLGLAC